MNEQKLRFIDWMPGVFIHPVKLFQAIKKRGPKLGDWLIPAAVLIALTIIVLVLDYANSTFAAARSDLPDGTSIALRQFNLKLEGTNEGINAALRLLSSPAMYIVSIMVGAALVWIIGRIAAANKFDFKACLSIVGVHQVVASVVALATLLIILITGEAFSFRIDQIIQTNLKSPASVLMAGIRPFVIYQLVVVAIGLYVFGGMTKWRATITGIGIMIAALIVFAI